MWLSRTGHGRATTRSRLKRPKSEVSEIGLSQRRHRVRRNTRLNVSRFPPAKNHYVPRKTEIASRSRHQNEGLGAFITLPIDRPGRRSTMSDERGNGAM